MDLKKVHSIANRFQKNIFKDSSFINSGFFASSFKGSGLQFKEHQIYNYGDEIRFIDWKLLARKNIPYIKTFEEERNVEVKIIIDCHKNYILSYDGISKFVNILEMCALLILFAGKTKDFISCYVLGKRPIVIKKLSGENGILKFISLLSNEGIVSDDGFLNLDNYINFCNDEFSNKNYSHLSEIKKGPFVIFSIPDKDKFDFFRKILRNENTHFFNLKCPFEKDLSKYRYTFTGLKINNRYRDIKDLDSCDKYIKNIFLDEMPLTSFVEGLMSHDKKL